MGYLKKLFCIALFLSTAICLADPRFPLPSTPDQIWQNDRDLRDMVDSRISKSSGGYELSGVISQPRQPSFLATFTHTPTNVTGDSTPWTVEFSSSIYNIGGYFDTTTYTFTAPRDGQYIFSTGLRVGGFTQDNDTITFVIYTSERSYALVSTNQPAGGGTMAFTNSTIARMKAGEIARISINVDGEGSDNLDPIGGSYSWFSGSLLN